MHFHTTLYTAYNWLYNEKSTDAATDCRNQAIGLAIPFGYIKEHKYPWFILRRIIIFTGVFLRSKAVSVANLLSNVNFLK
jgi:hypothetical protein